MHNKDVMVLVTGGTGFIAQYCILALLERGYRVRTTVRALTRETEVREHLRAGGAEPGDRLSFIAADLGNDAGWAEAAEGCTYVLHGASPTPTGKQVSVSGMTIFRFAGGKIVEEWLQEDTMGMLQQLGFMPSQE